MNSTSDNQDNFKRFKPAVIVVIIEQLHFTKPGLRLCFKSSLQYVVCQRFAMVRILNIGGNKTNCLPWSTVLQKPSLPSFKKKIIHHEEVYKANQLSPFNFVNYISRIYTRI